MKKAGLLIILLSAVFAACYYDKDELINPTDLNCNTENVSYSGTVVPLLQANGCLGCHSGGAPSGNISLSGYAAVKTVALNGKLHGAINHTPGFSPMPQGGNKMSACAIQQIKAWIDAGSIDN
ncbi:MAG: hypothetical protein R2796_05365 [Chitinophagaceae bacterium]|nr:hypothetical protein [Chitinophagaceae bacterium]